MENTWWMGSSCQKLITVSKPNKLEFEIMHFAMHGTEAGASSFFDHIVKAETQKNDNCITVVM
jgi:hypothetical protein